MARKRRTPLPSPPPPSSPSVADLLASPAGRKRTKRALLDPVLSPPLQKKARSMQTRSSSRRESTVTSKLATFFSRSVDTTPPDTAPLVTIQPDPHLPHPYRHEARVVQVRGVVYDAMLTRVRAAARDCGCGCCADGVLLLLLLTLGVRARESERVHRAAGAGA